MDKSSFSYMVSIGIPAIAANDILEQTRKDLISYPFHEKDIARQQLIRQRIDLFFFVNRKQKVFRKEERKVIVEYKNKHNI